MLILDNCFACSNLFNYLSVISLFLMIFYFGKCFLFFGKCSGKEKTISFMCYIECGRLYQDICQRNADRMIEKGTHAFKINCKDSALINCAKS